MPLNISRHMAHRFSPDLQTHLQTHSLDLLFYLTTFKLFKLLLILWNFSKQNKNVLEVKTFVFSVCMFSADHSLKNH